MTATTLRQRTLRDAFLHEPAQLAKDQPHQVLISGVSVTLTAIFFASSGVVPLPLAVGGAIGVEYAYLKGLSDAAYTGSPWGRRLIWTAFAIIAIAGTYVLLKETYKVPWLEAPAVWLATVLSLLHIIPLAFLGLCSAMLHTEAEGRRARLIEEAEAEERRRAEERGTEERERERRRQAAQDAAEARKLEALAEIEAEKAKALARLEYRTLAAQRTAQAPAQSPHAAAQRQMSRDELYAAVRAAYAENPEFSRADLARRSGWSEAMVRKALREIVA